MKYAGIQRWVQASVQLLLPVTLIACYWQCAGEMWNRWFPAWQQENLSLYHRLVDGESYYTHGPLTLVVSLAIVILLVRNIRIKVRPAPPAGIAVTLVFLLIHLVGSFARVSFVSGFSLVGTLTGLTIWLWGFAALKRLWFALALLLFMIPLPEVTIADLNFRLKMFAADWGVRLANQLGVISLRAGNQAFLEGGKSLVIANVCNGLRTLISLIGFGAIYAYVCRLRGSLRIFLFAMSLPIAIVSNAIRVAGLILIANHYSVQAATGWFHDLSGLLIFAMAICMMFGLEKLILACRRLFGRPEAETRLFGTNRKTEQDSNQTRRLLGAMGGKQALLAAGTLGLVAIGLWRMDHIASGASARLVREDILPKELVLKSTRFDGYDLELDQRTLLVLESPEYLYRRYVDAHNTQAPLDFCLILSRNNRKGIHPPDLCLEGSGQNVLAKSNVTVPLIQNNTSLPCRELIVQEDENQYYYLYTYKCGPTYTRSFWEQQFTIFTNGLLARDSSGALIRVSTRVDSGKIDQARDAAHILLQQIMPHLDRILR